MGFMITVSILLIIVGLLILGLSVWYGNYKLKKRKTRFKTRQKYQGWLLTGIVLVIAGLLSLVGLSLL